MRIQAIHQGYVVFHGLVNRNFPTTPGYAFHTEDKKVFRPTGESQEQFGVQTNKPRLQHASTMYDI